MSESNNVDSDLSKNLNLVEKPADGDEASGKDGAKDHRYAKTYQVFQQMGLLEYTLQMAKLCKESELLQQKINSLEKEVNESSQKARKGLKEKLDQVSQAPSDSPPT